NGPVAFAFSNAIDITIEGGPQVNANHSDNLVMLTGGNLTLNRGYQNAGDGDIVLVAGWDGVGAFSGGSASHVVGSAPVLVIPDFDFDSLGGVGQNGGTLTVGSAAQTDAVRIGSRAGRNGFGGHGIVLTAGTTGAFATQLGFYGGSSAITGGIALRAGAGGLSLTGGAANAFAQVGHGGRGIAHPDIDALIDVRFDEAGALTLSSGTGASAYTQIGHGGANSNGNYAGNITILNAASLELNA